MLESTFWLWNRWIFQVYYQVLFTLEKYLPFTKTKMRNLYESVFVPNVYIWRVLCQQICGRAEQRVEQRTLAISSSVTWEEVCAKRVYISVSAEVEEQTQEQVAVLQEVTRVLLNFITTTPEAWAPIVSSVSRLLFAVIRLHAKLSLGRCQQVPKPQEVGIGKLYLGLHCHHQNDSAFSWAVVWATLMVH